VDDALGWNYNLAAAEGPGGMVASGKAAADLLPARSAWPNWPPNYGFIEGTVERRFLMPGDAVDRFGRAGGYSVAPLGTPVEMRSLWPGTEQIGYNAYQVLKPIEVQAGGTLPWFGQPGLGTQFKLPVSIDILLDRGFLKPLPPLPKP